MTDDLLAAKRVVRDMYAALDAAAPKRAGAVLADHVVPDWHWQGMHPFEQQSGPEAVGDIFWTPVKDALGPVQRRPDMFLAGRNALDEGASLWVAEMGHLMGNWNAPFLGVGPSRKLTFLRYVEFHRVEGGRIVQTACYVDLLDLIRQAGLWPLPSQTGAALLTPGPRTNDGVMIDPQDPAEGQATNDLIGAMVDDLRSLGVASPEDHLKRFWHRDMCWFGPAGIGASAFFDGYRRGHTRPFEEGLEFGRVGGHTTRIAEGNFGGFFGYPSILMRPTGGFLGLPASAEPAEMRIVDMYRREGDKLAENWIFIDLLHFLSMQGLDVLNRLKEYPRT